MESDTNEANPQVKLGGGCDASQSGGRAKDNPGEPLACERQQQDLQEWGWAAEGETCPLSPALTCPYEMDAMAPAVYRPTPGSSFCSSSAVLGIRPASSDTTWQ